MATMRYVVIMAGGSGTRLWPLSRRGTPKQLLTLIDGRSLLQEACDRAVRLVPADRVLVVTGGGYADAVREQLPMLPADNILGEPEGRDSLNAVAWPAAVLAAQDPEAVIAQLTADQLIEPVEAFVAAVDAAFGVAESDPAAIVTLGVVPTEPHTGYGYLHRGELLDRETGAYAVQSFKEKPDGETAQAYLDSGEYWWNSGMFVFRAALLLDQVERLEPETHATVLELARHPERLGELFGTLRKISLDYAIMEPVSRGEGSAHIAAVPLPIRWRDVGGYASLAEALPTDTQGNVVAGGGHAVLASTTSSVVFNDVPGHLVALLGVEGLVVVHTPDATLITTPEYSEQVKALVSEVSTSVGPEFV